MEQAERVLETALAFAEAGSDPAMAVEGLLSASLGSRSAVVMAYHDCLGLVHRAPGGGSVELAADLLRRALDAGSWSPPEEGWTEALDMRRSISAEL